MEEPGNYIRSDRKLKVVNLRCKAASIWMFCERVEIPFPPLLSCDSSVSAKEPSPRPPQKKTIKKKINCEIFFIIASFTSEAMVL